MYIIPSKPNKSVRQDKHFVPSMFLSNVMSLAPKIDELAYSVINANFYIVCITETWLQKHIPDSAVDIQGYNLIRLDRSSTVHGGVCIYLNELIHFTGLDDLTDKTDGLEVLWIKIRPHRLPRGISDIIIGLVYHPPTTNNSVMFDYLISCLSDIDPNTRTAV